MSILTNQDAFSKNPHGVHDQAFLKKLPRLLSTLVQAGHISLQEACVVLDVQKKNPRSLVGLLVTMGFVSQDLLDHHLEVHGFSRPFILENLLKNPYLSKKYPRYRAEHEGILPFLINDEGIHVLLAPKVSYGALEKCQEILAHPGKDWVLYRGSKKDFYDALAFFYQENPQPAPFLKDKSADIFQEKAPPTDHIPFAETTVQNPEIFLQNVLNRCIRRRASDLHIEAYAHHMSFRMRIDGVLHPLCTLCLDAWTEIRNTLKIWSKLDISEGRRPQSGGFSHVFEGRTLFFRVSTHPTQHGESVCVRLLNGYQKTHTLETLGMDVHHQNVLKHWLQARMGMILVVGPTGSGKTTTLYACMMHLNTPEKNIMTLEDPIEYQLPRIRQSTIQADVMGFSEGVRSLLRHDPDVMMIGEIRDENTAQSAMRASLTGHLVLSTLHAPDALSCLRRLEDLSLRPSQWESVLKAILAQRLFRKKCDGCQRKISPSCPLCHGTGYAGRFALVEVLALSPTIIDMYHKGMSFQALFSTAKKEGFIPLRTQALEKVTQGWTTEEEVMRVLGPPAIWEESP